MLQNARVTAFNVSELTGENQQGVKLSPSQIRDKECSQRMLDDLDSSGH